MPSGQIGASRMHDDVSKRLVRGGRRPATTCSAFMSSTAQYQRPYRDHRWRTGATPPTRCCTCAVQRRHQSGTRAGRWRSWCQRVRNTTVQRSLR